MKVNELMIGDLVNVNGLNLKVGAIHADEIGVFDPDFKIYWCSDDGLDRIDPIPLTDEILNKNFSRDTANHQWFIGSADIKCRISMVNDRYSWMEGCKKVYFIELRYNHTEIRKQINFVHELQRCFVLCEYEKEIEL